MLGGSAIPFNFVSDEDSSLGVEGIATPETPGTGSTTILGRNSCEGFFSSTGEGGANRL
jgi:hypothetical protein